MSGHFSFRSSHSSSGQRDIKGHLQQGGAKPGGAKTIDDFVAEAQSLGLDLSLEDVRLFKGWLEGIERTDILNLRSGGNSEAALRLFAALGGLVHDFSRGHSAGRVQLVMVPAIAVIPDAVAEALKQLGAALDLDKPSENTAGIDVSPVAPLPVTLNIGARRNELTITRAQGQALLGDCNDCGGIWSHTVDVDEIPMGDGKLNRHIRRQLEHLHIPGNAKGRVPGGPSVGSPTPLKPQIHRMGEAKGRRSSEDRPLTIRGLPDDKPVARRLDLSLVEPAVPNTAHVNGVSPRPAKGDKGDGNSNDGMGPKDGRGSAGSRPALPSHPTWVSADGRLQLLPDLDHKNTRSVRFDAKLKPAERAEDAEWIDGWVRAMEDGRLDLRKEQAGALPMRLYEFTKSQAFSRLPKGAIRELCLPLDLNRQLVGHSLRTILPKHGFVVLDVPSMLDAELDCSGWHGLAVKFEASGPPRPVALEVVMDLPHVIGADHEDKVKTEYVDGRAEPVFILTIPAQHIPGAPAFEQASLDFDALMCKLTQEKGSPLPLERSVLRALYMETALALPTGANRSIDARKYPRAAYETCGITEPTVLRRFKESLAKTCGATVIHDPLEPPAPPPAGERKTHAVPERLRVEDSFRKAKLNDLGNCLNMREVIERLKPFVEKAKSGEIRSVRLPAWVADAGSSAREELAQYGITVHFHGGREMVGVFSESRFPSPAKGPGHSLAFRKVFGEARVPLAADKPDYPDALNYFHKLRFAARRVFHPPIARIDEDLLCQLFVRSVVETPAAADRRVFYFSAPDAKASGLNHPEIARVFVELLREARRDKGLLRDAPIELRIVDHVRGDPAAPRKDADLLATISQSSVFKELRARSMIGIQSGFPDAEAFMRWARLPGGVSSQSALKVFRKCVLEITAFADDKKTGIQPDAGSLAVVFGQIEELLRKGKKDPDDFDWAKATTLLWQAILLKYPATAEEMRRREQPLDRLMDALESPGTSRAHRNRLIDSALLLFIPPHLRTPAYEEERVRQFMQQRSIAPGRRLAAQRLRPDAPQDNPSWKVVDPILRLIFEAGNDSEQDYRRIYDRFLAPGTKVRRFIDPATQALADVLAMPGCHDREQARFALGLVIDDLYAAKGDQGPRLGGSPDGKSEVAEPLEDVESKGIVTRLREERVLEVNRLKAIAWWEDPATQKQLAAKVAEIRKAKAASPRELEFAAYYEDLTGWMRNPMSGDLTEIVANASKTPSAYMEDEIGRLFQPSVWPVGSLEVAFEQAQELAARCTEISPSDWPFDRRPSTRHAKSHRRVASAKAAAASLREPPALHSRGIDGKAGPFPAPGAASPLHPWQDPSRADAKAWAQITATDVWKDIEARKALARLSEGSGIDLSFTTLPDDDGQTEFHVQYTEFIAADEVTPAAWESVAALYVPPPDDVHRRVDSLGKLVSALQGSPGRKRHLLLQAAAHILKPDQAHAAALAASGAAFREKLRKDMAWLDDHQLSRVLGDNLGALQALQTFAGSQAPTFAEFTKLCDFLVDPARAANLTAQTAALIDAVKSAGEEHYAGDLGVAVATEAGRDIYSSHIDEVAALREEHARRNAAGAGASGPGQRESKEPVSQDGPPPIDPPSIKPLAHRPLEWRRQHWGRIAARVRDVTAKLRGEDGQPIHGQYLDFLHQVGKLEYNEHLRRLRPIDDRYAQGAKAAIDGIRPALSTTLQDWIAEVIGLDSLTVETAQALVACIDMEMSYRVAQDDDDDRLEIEGIEKPSWFGTEPEPPALEPPELRDEAREGMSEPQPVSPSAEPMIGPAGKPSALHEDSSMEPKESKSGVPATRRKPVRRVVSQSLRPARPDDGRQPLLPVKPATQLPEVIVFRVATVDWLSRPESEAQLQTAAEEIENRGARTQREANYLALYKGRALLDGTPDLATVTTYLGGSMEPLSDRLEGRRQRAGEPNPRRSMPEMIQNARDVRDQMLWEEVYLLHPGKVAPPPWLAAQIASDSKQEPAASRGASSQLAEPAPAKLRELTVANARAHWANVPTKWMSHLHRQVFNKWSDPALAPFLKFHAQWQEMRKPLWGIRKISKSEVLKFCTPGVTASLSPALLKRISELRETTFPAPSDCSAAIAQIGAELCWTVNQRVADPIAAMKIPPWI